LRGRAGGRPDPRRAGDAAAGRHHGDTDLVVYAYGTPPEDEHAEILDPAV
jgi:hypothetical protein